MAPLMQGCDEKYAQLCIAVFLITCQVAMLLFLWCFWESANCRGRLRLKREYLQHGDEHGPKAVEKDSIGGGFGAQPSVRIGERSMSRLVLTLDAADESCLYISHGRDKDPVGRIRIVRVRGRDIVVAVEGDEAQLGVYREKALKKAMGADAVDLLEQRFA